MESLHLYNTLSRKKEKFEALNHPHVGMYVCGPTVYSDPHLGNMRGALAWDILYRYLVFLGYKVRYVRNITDVGHLESDSDTGEDKMEKRARLEKKEPMEIAHYYTRRYHHYVRELNMLSPDIEPTASGHIPEQIDFVKKIIENGMAYESNGSVYLDVEAYNKNFEYGKLSGRDLEQLQEGYRDLEGQDEKRSSQDFALWKHADEKKLMKWDSPWGPGVPGWHLECTVMSTKYLGDKYDIHGGGIDLLFPHHEAEVTQSNACHGVHHPNEQDEANFWLHNNMVNLYGVKMSKSRDNTISLDELYNGTSKHLSQAYTPMVARFAFLQAHYRSTIEFSDEALQAAEKAYNRMCNTLTRLNEIDPAAVEHKMDGERAEIFNRFAGIAKGHMDDDLNTARVIAAMFDTCSLINEIYFKQSALPLPVDEFEAFRKVFNDYFYEVLGLLVEEKESAGGALTEGLVQLLIDLRADAKTEKNWGAADKIRDQLGALGVKLKDTKDGVEWTFEEEKEVKGIEADSRFIH